MKFSSQDMFMPIPTAADLTRSYKALYPNEIDEGRESEHEEVLGRWLLRCAGDPASAVATSNWAGKVTRALFHALGEPMQRTKGDMVSVLTERLAPQQPPVDEAEMSFSR
jgi:hypothetical protein